LTAPLFILDGPQYHQLQPVRRHRLEGVALALDGEPLVALQLLRNGSTMGEGPIDIESPHLAGLPGVRRTHCRFSLEAELEPVAHEITGVTSAGERVPLFFFDPPRDEMPRMERVAAGVLAMPVPPGEVVGVTQGGDNVPGYMHSAVSGLFTLRALLQRAGHDPDRLRNVLDVGCGTGRSLLGWHVDDPTRALTGADINPELIGWASHALPEVASWIVSRVEPPLPLPDASFDLIQLASVFTHLPLSMQRAWLSELRRLVRPGGAVVITLHGEVYVRLMLDAAAQEAFERAGGYAEFAAAAPGANAFSTFHSREFATALFGEQFDSVQWFPRANDPLRPSLFPFASAQDVYVMG
jgi:SAM-dependent methyltransferase